MNEIEAIETSTEVVDGRQKVRRGALIVIVAPRGSPPPHTPQSGDYYNTIT